MEYVIATSVNSGFDHECESLIKKINFYLCGKYSEISLKIEAGENVGEKIKWHPLLLCKLHNHNICTHFPRNFKRFISIG